MEINHYGDTILGVIPQEDIVEGRMILLTSNVHTYDFGSKEDLPGVKLPDTAAESVKARYVITFAQDNRSLPLYQPQPAYDWALRYGWEQTGNAPFAATVYLTHPGVQEGQTIPSGAGAVAFGEGIYTVPSGGYVYSAALETPGTPLDVCNTAEDGASDAGKLKEGTTAPVAEVIRFNTTNSALTFKIYH